MSRRPAAAARASSEQGGGSSRDAGAGVATDVAVDSARWLASAARRSRARACAAEQVVTLAALVNGRAAGGEAAGHRGLAAALSRRELFAMTLHLAELEDALYGLVVEQGANVLAIAGGDGTVHSAVGMLLAVRAAEIAAGLPPSPLPRLLLLGGGTLNIVARTVGIRGQPLATVERFVCYFQHAQLSRVPARQLATLDVRHAGRRRFGFVFGSEVAHHAIELYMRFGAGYRGLGQFLFELTRGALVGGALWRAESWRLGPFEGALDVDGRRYEPFTAVVATTIDLTLAIGGVRAIRRPLGAPGFHAKIVHAPTARALVAMVPALMRERPHAGVIDLPNAERMALRGPYTLDGECFGGEDVAHGRRPLQVVVGPSLPAVPAELGMMRW